MKYVVDTCGWIEWLANGSLKPKFAHYLQHNENLIIPTLVQMELFKWVSREKNEEAAAAVIGVTSQCHVVDLDTSIALSAAAISTQFQLALADSIIYATAQRHRAQVVTCDKHFRLLENVLYFAKQ